MSSPVPSRVRSMRLKRKRSTSSQEEPSPSKIPKASWNDFTTKSLLEVMIEEIHAGNRVNGNFNPDGWRNIVRKFGLRTGLPYTKVQLRNRSALIRKIYAKWRKCCDRATGLGVDPRTGTITANDEWWEQMGQEDPEVLKWKSAPPKFLDLMTECFAGGVATGKDTYYPSYCRGGGTFPPLPRPAPPVMATTDVPPCIAVDGDVAGSNVLPNSGSPMSVTPNGSRSKRSRLGTPKLSTGDRMCSSLEAHVVEQRRKNEILSSMFDKKEEYNSIDEAMRLLQKLEGIQKNSQFYLDAMKVISNNKKRYFFINYVSELEPELQIKWFSQWM